jgi:hypothetical protein
MRVIVIVATPFMQLISARSVATLWRSWLIGSLRPARAVAESSCSVLVSGAPEQSEASIAGA